MPPVAVFVDSVSWAFNTGRKNWNQQGALDGSEMAVLNMVFVMAGL